MTTTTLTPTRNAERGTRNLATISPVDQQILAAYQDAVAHQNTAAIKMIICGYLLIEKRNAMLPQCHSGTPVKIRENGQFSKNPEGRFDEWIEATGMTKRTAYRWMEAAERVGHCQLNVPLAMELPSTIDVEGVAVPLSQALTAPEDELTAAALKFRQGVFEFMADKTLSDALNASLDGESPAHRITRAHAGKTKGGKGQQDRKEFEKFTATKLGHLSTFFRQKLSQTQRALIIAAFHAALQAWPRWLLEAVADKCRTELKLDEIQRAARTEI